MTTPVVILRRRQYAKALLTVTVAGTSVSLSGIQLDPYNRLVVTQGYPWLMYGFGVVDVRYEAAYTDTCPGDLREAASQAARFRLLQTDGASGIPNRATSMTNEFGNVQLSTAGKDRPTGIPDVDAVINSYAQQARIPGLA